MTTVYVAILHLDSETAADYREAGWSWHQAEAWAVHRAEAFYGNADASWYERIEPGDYHAGLVLPDGTRSVPLVRIVVREDVSDPA